MVEKAKTCAVCGNDIKGEYLQASLDEKLKPAENGAVVCSQECAQVYENKLPFRGHPIQHWSRITGYYQNVAGWDKSKKQELKDRKRYELG